MRSVFICSLLLLAAKVTLAQDPYLAEIKIWPGNFVPSGWAACNGQILAINQNQALFSLLGTIYGGNGVTNFALPDLRGRVPRGTGQGNGFNSVQLGLQGGSESTTTAQATVQGSLSSANLPAHSHQATFTGQTATNEFPTTLKVGTSPGSITPANNGWLTASSPAGVSSANVYAAPGSTPPSVSLNGGLVVVTTTPQGTVDVSGGGTTPPTPFVASGLVQPFSNMDPYLGLNYIIATQGIYPPRP